MINSASFHKFLEDHLGLGAYQSQQRLGGGDINEAYRINFSEASVFLKTKQKVDLDFYQAEANGLSALREAEHALRLPKVLAIDCFQTQAFLVLEYLEEGNPSASFDSSLGQGLAQLHKNTSRKFGWEQDNYIGALVQVNSPSTDWVEFYAQNRLEALFAKAYDKGLLTKGDRAALFALIKELDSLIPKEAPALIHGDLWSGNYLCDSDSNPVLIDPAVYYGHREMDLAMMHLFGGFSPDIFRSYEEFKPLEPGFEDRLSIHQLYPLLVHLNLFGSSYLASCRAIWSAYT